MRLKRSPIPISSLLWWLTMLVALGQLAFLLTGASRVPAPFNAQAGEAFWMPMDDTGATGWVDDVSPGNQNRKLNSGTDDSHTTTTAVTGTALAFSGADDGNDLLILADGSGNANAEWLVSATSAGKDFTLAAWFRLHDRAGAQSPITILTGGAFQLRVHANGGTLAIYVWSSGQETVFAYWGLSPGTVWSDQWQYLVISRSGTNHKAWLNGEVYYEPGVDATAGDWYVSAGSYANRFNLGSQGGYYPAQCVIDDVRLYSRALTATEVALLYNSGAGRSTPLPRP
jgi:hypothetical protein